MASKYFIYLITNLTYNKVYVGKSVSPSTRWSDHKKIAMGGKKKYRTDFAIIHAAIKKYGIDNFKFNIIDELDDEIESYLAETKWILLLCSNLKKYGYNCNLGGEGGVQPTERSRQKMSIAQNKPELLKLHSDQMKQRHKDNPGFLSGIHKGNKYTKGRKLTQKEKDNLSKKFSGRVFSEEHKQKIQQALPKGENVKSSKLTEKQVIEIRKKYVPCKYGCVKLGREYGVDAETIRRIVLRKIWRHI